MAENIEIQLKSTPVFRITVTDGGTFRPVDSFTTLEFRFEKTNHSTMIRTGSFETDGTDGVVIYKALKEEIDISGQWKLQFHGIDGTDEIFTEIDTFNVIGNI